MANPQKVVAFLNESLRDRIRKDNPPREGEPYRPTSVWASRISPCARKMALDMLHPEDQEQPTVEGYARMTQGQEMEEVVMHQLGNAGRIADPSYSVIERQQRVVIKDRDGLELIVAKIDGRLKFARGVKEKPIVEAKWGRSYMHCESLDDLNAGRWSRGAVDQMLCYLLGLGEPWGVFVIPRVSDFPALIPVVLEEHLERAEAALTSARLAVLARQTPDSTLPPYTPDSSICRICPHLKKSCHPPHFDYGPGMQLLEDDEVLLLNLQTREQHAAAFSEYTRADKAAKARLRGVESALCGPFQITGKWGAQTRYDIPADVKAQYAVEDPKGRFIVTIERAVK
jgi:hypothetical protein